MKAKPSPQPTSTLPGPEDITRVVLPNGIVILARPNFNSPSVNVSGYLLVGALFEPDEILGLADYTAEMLMRGTAQRSFQQLYDSLESAGASFGFSSGTHTTSFGGKALAEDLNLLLGVLSETVRNPVFPSEHVERLRAQLLAQLAIRAQDTDSMAVLAFDKILYGEHPYSRPTDGYTETVQAITREDLVAFHQKYYGPRGAVITIVGAVEPDLAVEKVALALGDWGNPGQPELPALPALKPLTKTIQQNITLPGKSQASLIMGIAGPPRQDPDFLAVSLGNNILGQFGLYGRIGAVVRQQQGLAYYAYSQVSGGNGPGPWYVSAGAAPENVKKVIQLISKEIKRYTHQPVSAEELSDSQAHFIGSLPISLESNNGVAAALLNLERYQLGLDYYQRYPDLVCAVTPELILEVSRRYLASGNLAIAVAGP
jgi:zinc protease